MHTIMFSPELLKNAKGGPPPAQFLLIIRWLYIFAGIWIVSMGLLNLSSGWCILKRRARMFSFVVAGLNGLGFPFGTALSVFTFIVLLRDSVTELYAKARFHSASRAG